MDLPNCMEEPVMKYIKKLLCLLLIMFLVIGMFFSVQAEAKEISISVPKIKVKTVKKGTSLKVTIYKTKDAEGYEVYVSGAGSAYSDYMQFSTDYQKVADVTKNGKAKRTITFKTFPAGTYKVKVRSYNNKKFGYKIYSDFSTEKSITLKEASNGYKSSYDFSKIKKGDIIKFGAYEQDGDFSNGKEPIEWIVLEKTKKDLFVVSKYAIDSIPYNNDYNNDVTWERCYLRKWLNDKFYSNSFNKTEKGMIKVTTVENYDNVVYKTVGGNDTKDRIFLLSQLEMINSDYGFSDSYDEYDINRRCTPTAYATTRNIETSTFYKTINDENACTWWLRTPGLMPYAAALVGENGSVVPNGDHVYDIGYGLRPALHISVK